MANSTYIEKIIYAASPEEAFDKAYDEDKKEYGESADNGTFTSCEYNGKVLKAFSGNYIPANCETARELVMGKAGNDFYAGTCYAVDMGVSHYETLHEDFTLNEKDQDFTLNEKDRYHYMVTADGISFTKAKTLKEARATAHEFIVRHRCPVYIHTVSPRIIVTPSFKEYDKEPPATEEKNTVVRKIHAYYLGTYAPI